MVVDLSAVPTIDGTVVHEFSNLFKEHARRCVYAAWLCFIVLTQLDRALQFCRLCSRWLPPRCKGEVGYAAEL